jgi:uncharacterized protein Usg
MAQTRTPAAGRVSDRRADPDFARQLLGYSLTTAEILYHLPDHPALLQSYVWQDYDMHPRFPKLKGFLDFWTHNLDGAVNRVRVAHRGLISAREFQFVNGALVLN